MKRCDARAAGSLYRHLAVLILLAITVVAAAAWSFMGGLQPATPCTGGDISSCKGTARCLSGTVTHIVDGDTLDVDGQRIRLTLVNTPETGDPGYQEAKDFTASTCPVGSRALVDEDDGQTGGSYGRIIAVVYCGATILNAALLQSGYAVILTQYCSVSEFASEPWATACG